MTSILAVMLGTLAAGSEVGAGPTAAPGHRILVFTKTSGFRHTSIPVAIRAVRQLGARSGLTVDATEDSGAFTPSNLERYKAVVFLLTTGDVLNVGQQAAFERFLRAGGGYVGVHSAADTEYDWAWYGRLLGTRFRNHPQIQRATINISTRGHPSTTGLPQRWTRVDEWYNFTRNPRRSVSVLATLDESSYAPGEGAMGADHPIAWSQAYQGGRAWYTGGGHTDESYAEPGFRRHLLGGLRYAAGVSPPAIISTRRLVRAGRLIVQVRYRSCDPCNGRLDVLVRGRRVSTRIRFGGGVGQARSARLPRGRWRTSVVLTDPSTGLSDVHSRTVRVG
jgi:cytochrome c